MHTLTELHAASGLVLTAHRGASFDDAENTLSAFELAAQCGAHFIEFDLRMSADGVPVVLHDPTIDRTSDGHGRPEDHSLAELKRYDFSYYSHFERRQKPLHPGLAIPTFEEVLKTFRDRCCMNIQVYADAGGLREICRLYLDYGMRDRGYLTIADAAAARQVRAYSPDIEICLTPGWGDRSNPANLRKCADFGCRFVQPTADSMTPEKFALCRELGLKANVLLADSPEDAVRLQELGADSLLTNKIVLLTSSHLRDLL